MFYMITYTNHKIKQEAELYMELCSISSAAIICVCGFPTPAENREFEQTEAIPKPGCKATPAQKSPLPPLA